MIIILYFLWIYILFHFSEAQTCPEEYRPHKTRCDAYFKCVILPTNNHIWIPAKCERGLIFEPILKECVLPNDNWDCNIDNKLEKNSDENIIYDLLESFPNKDDKNLETDLIMISNNKNDYLSINNYNKNTTNDEILFESSGDGLNDSGDYIEVKENDYIDIPETPSKIDPKLTQHLQRLSQLINGLKKSYKKNSNKDLRPDQLNAFLAHFNIKNEFDNIDTTKTIKIHNSTKNSLLNVGGKVPAETKIIIKNIAGKKFKNNEAYSNSQIVVNRPGGSVVFSLSPNGINKENENKNKYDFYNSEPKITQDTLKTVLELSKEMIKNQNFRQILPRTDSSEYLDYYKPSHSSHYPPHLSHYPEHYHAQHYTEYHPDHYGNHHHHPIDKITYVNHNQNEKIPTTIIHNHVMPVQISTNGEHGYHKPYKTTTTSKAPTTTPSSTTTTTIATTTTTKKPYHQIYYPHHHHGNHNHGHHHGHHHHGHNHHHGHHHPYGHQDLLYDSYGNPISSEYYSSEISKLESVKDTIDRFNPTTESLKNVLPQYIKRFYTPNPHLDDSNANQVYDGENFPVLNYNNRKPEIILSNPPWIKNEESLESFIDKTKEVDSDITFENSVPHYVIENNVSKKIVNNRLTPMNLDQKLYGSINNKVKQHNNRKLVKIGDSYMSYDTYQNELLPALNGNFYDTHVEIISCNPGVRQPNETDCTKYYVCSKIDGKTLTYSCPPYTGFNSETKICDAKTYAECHPTPFLSTNNYYNTNENKKIQLQVLQALQEAKIIRAEALQAQNEANIIRTKTQNDIAETLKYQPTISPIINYVTATAYSVPSDINTSGISNQNRKRKYYCKEGDKIADQTSVLNYYVCYKGKDGKMNGHKMTCSSGLMFCAKTKLCTLPKKCNNS